jgi:dihydrolipoamide dehydrogenase
MKNKSIKQYDTIVIGSGGGTKLVRPVANLGKKVAILEKETPGGTCLNRGCIPSKMLIYPANIVHHTKDLNRIQLKREGSWEVDFAKMVQRISQTVDEESQSILPVYEKHHNIDYYPYHGKFVANKEIEVNGELITADKIFLAVGARPRIPDIEGLAGTPYWTSREALRNLTLPKKLVVYGGGYIALELGMAYAAFGTEVCFVIRSKLLREEDHEIRDGFRSAVSGKVTIHEGCSIRRVVYKENNFSIYLSEGSHEIVDCDAFLIATGIVPNTDDLGLENTNAELDSEGYIQTNEYLETSEKSIFALGDAAGRYFFRHSVNFEGDYLFENQYKKPSPSPIHYPPMPSAVFTYPEIARVGLTEELCRLGGFDFIKAVHSYSSSATGMARLPEFGFVKLLVDKNTQKLLGAHILGDEASNLIHLMILGMTSGCKLDDYLKMIYIHPALPEIARNAFRKAKEILSQD